MSSSKCAPHNMNTGRYYLIRRPKKAFIMEQNTHVWFVPSIMMCCIVVMGVTASSLAVLFAGRWLRCFPNLVLGSHASATAKYAFPA